MGDRQEEEPLLRPLGFDPVEEAVREARNEVPPNLEEHPMARSRMLAEAVERLLNRVEEDVSEPRGLPVIERRRLEELPPGQGVPRDSGHRSRDRASARTCSDGIAAAAPALISW